MSPAGHDPGSRLDRIEEKVDRLTEAVVDLARVEERIATMFRLHDDLMRTIADHSARLSGLERDAARSGGAGRAGAYAASVALAIITPTITGVVVYYVTRGG